MTIIHRIIAFVVIAFGMSYYPTIAQVRPIDPALFDKLCYSMQSKLTASLIGKKIPGATAAVLLPDGRMCAAAAGTRGKADGERLTTSDPILAGSIGKTFVSALALQLVEEGRLDLDQKIDRWLGKREWFPRLQNSRDLTVRMLMNHSSGIPNHAETDSFFKDATRDPLKDVQFDYLLSFILSKKPLFPAGKGFSYADTNYVLLAMIEEEITKTTMYDEVTRRFLGPLNLDHTSPSNKNVDPAVHGFYENKPVVKNERLMINPQWEWAGGGFWSTPSDLARWATELYGGKVLKRSSVDEMIGGTTSGEGKNYGLGVEVLSTKWGPSYGHDGEWPGYLSVMRYYPKFDVAVAVQYNADGTTEAERYGDAMVDDLGSTFLEELLTDKPEAAERNQLGQLATSWLHLIDSGKLAESWAGISPDLKTRYSRADWPGVMKSFLAKMGSLKSRRLRYVVRVDPDIITVDFVSSFAKLPIATETVRLQRYLGGNWLVSSYSVN